MLDEYVLIYISLSAAVVDSFKLSSRTGKLSPAHFGISGQGFPFWLLFPKKYTPCLEFSSTSLPGLIVFNGDVPANSI